MGLTYGAFIVIGTPPSEKKAKDIVKTVREILRNLPDDRQTRRHRRRIALLEALHKRYWNVERAHYDLRKGKAVANSVTIIHPPKIIGSPIEAVLASKSGVAWDKDPRDLSAAQKIIEDQIVRPRLADKLQTGLDAARNIISYIVMQANKSNISDEYASALITLTAWEASYAACHYENYHEMLWYIDVMRNVFRITNDPFIFATLRVAEGYYSRVTFRAGRPSHVGIHNAQALRALHEKRCSRLYGSLEVPYRIMIARAANEATWHGAGLQAVLPVLDGKSLEGALLDELKDPPDQGRFVRMNTVLAVAALNEGTTKGLSRSQEFLAAAMDAKNDIAAGPAQAELRVVAGQRLLRVNPNNEDARMTALGYLNTARTIFDSTRSKSWVDMIDKIKGEHGLPLD